MDDKKGTMGLGSLAGYAMSESDDEGEDMHKLTGNISGSDDENSSHSQVPSRNYSPVIRDDEPAKKKPAVSGLGLVSYGGHEEESDNEAKHSDGEGEEAPTEESTQDSQVPADSLSVETVHGATDSELNGLSQDLGPTDILMPPSPPGECSQELKESIARMHKAKQYRGADLDAAIQNNKSFRNPSIYEKLLSHVGIDEKGTNYPPELFDPSIWDKNSYYDELAKLQNIEMEKKKSEKKDRVKVDFITATKTGDSNDGSGRKSKWDGNAQHASQKPVGAGAVPTIPPVGVHIKKK